MSETWMKWLGWTTMLLLVMGAVGMFFCQYRTLDAAIGEAAAMTLRDDLYLTAPVFPAAWTEQPLLQDANGYDVNNLDAGMSGQCSGAYLLSVWTLTSASEENLPAVFVDGCAVALLNPGDVAQAGTYRMTSRTRPDGTGLTLCFDLVP